MISWVCVCAFTASSMPWMAGWCFVIHIGIEMKTRKKQIKLLTHNVLCQSIIILILSSNGKTTTLRNQFRNGLVLSGSCSCACYRKCFRCHHVWLLSFSSFARNKTISFQSANTISHLFCMQKQVAQASHQNIETMDVIIEHRANDKTFETGPLSAHDGPQIWIEWTDVGFFFLLIFRLWKFVDRFVGNSHFIRFAYLRASIVPYDNASSTFRAQQWQIEYTQQPYRHTLFEDGACACDQYCEGHFMSFLFLVSFYRAMRVLYAVQLLRSELNRSLWVQRILQSAIASEIFHYLFLESKIWWTLSNQRNHGKRSYNFVSNKNGKSQQMGSLFVCPRCKIVMDLVTKYTKQLLMFCRKVFRKSVAVVVHQFMCDLIRNWSPEKSKKIVIAAAWTQS